MLGEIQVFPIEYFHPFPWYEKFTPECVKEQTICIHHFEKSWLDESKKNQVFFTKEDNRNKILHFYHKIKYKLSRLFQK